tara:strand:+ start:892 stop:1581 length:690 start_codon:yes stop_codon:yes gene_type:complete
MAAPVCHWVRFQVKLTEEEYCLLKNNESVLQLNGEPLRVELMIFDKCNKTHVTIIGFVTIESTYAKVELKAVSPATPRIIHTFNLYKLEDNQASIGVINKCYNYEVMRYYINTNDKLKLQFPLTKEIKALFPKYYKEGDNVNVKLLVDEKSSGYDAILSMNKCYACIEVDISSNIAVLVSARNIKVVKDNKCNKDVLTCFSIFEHIRGRYGVKMYVCDYCYTFTDTLPF